MRVALPTGHHGFGPAAAGSGPTGEPAKIYGPRHSFPYDSSLRCDDSCRVRFTSAAVQLGTGSHHRQARLRRLLPTPGGFVANKKSHRDVSLPPPSADPWTPPAS